MNSDNYSSRIKYIVNNRLNLIISNPNIMGMGYGFKNINGNITNIPSLTFLVRKKLSTSSMNPNEIIPKFFNGIVTDIIESGKFRAPDEPIVNNGYNPYAAEKPTRPIVGGLSIQNPTNDYWGTSGYAVVQAPGKESIFLLTAGHILRSKDIKDRIYLIQPKYQPGETIGSRDKEKLGKLYIVNNLAFPKDPDSPTPKESNLYDVCFIALGDNNATTRKNIIAPGFPDKSRISGVVPLLSNGIVDLTISPLKPPTVTIYGSESGKQNGSLLLNPYTHLGRFTTGAIKDKIAIFQNQLAVNIKAHNGDCGALGVIDKDRRAFGLLMTVTDPDKPAPLAVFNPLAAILENYDMEILK